LSYERCPTAIERDRQRKAEYDQQRLSARQRGYSSKWEQAREGYLKLHPTCAICGKPATVVDHIRPHKGDKALFWNPFVPIAIIHSSSHRSAGHEP
jgi:5-methylcytosine-specific restriction endonuclease McrA